MATTTTAQGGCRGDTSIYNQNGLTVPFKNLCGKDIQKVVDFLDPTDELTWSDCLDRCVMKAPLCYGFDFTPHGTTDFSCWLMNATFAESDAKTQTYKVDAAMVDPELMSGLSSDCRTLGLQGCFQKNGQLGAATSPWATTSPASSQPTRVTPATVATTAVTTDAGEKLSTVIMTVVTTLAVGTAESTGAVPPASTPSELSIGVKAGIGAGIGAVVLVAILVAMFCVLKRRRRKDESVDPPAYQSMNEKIIGNDPHRQGVAELQAHHYGPYGSPELAGSAPPKGSLAFGPREQIHEIDGSTRYEK